MTSGMIIHKREPEVPPMTVTLKQRTCATADGKAVPDGHPDSAFLVGPPGARITDEKAAALGLVNGAFPKKMLVATQDSTVLRNPPPEIPPEDTTAKSDKAVRLDKSRKANRENKNLDKPER